MPQSNRKDVRNAVEAAAKAQPGWEKRTGFNRAQILFYLAENLELRRAELGVRISHLTGASAAEAEAEVDLSVRRLFYWASYADKYGGCVQETQLYGTVIRLHEPVGELVMGSGKARGRPLELAWARKKALIYRKC